MASVTTNVERRRGGWRWHLSYWLGRLYRLIRLLLLPPLPSKTLQSTRNEEFFVSEDEDDYYDDDQSLIFIVDDDITPPRRMTTDSVGYDLFSPKNAHINPGESFCIDTGVRVRPPRGFHVRLHSRSSLAAKGIQCFPGIIDPGKQKNRFFTFLRDPQSLIIFIIADYKESIKCLLTNSTRSRFDVSAGQRIAQLTVEKGSGNLRVLLVKKKGRLATSISSESIKRVGGFGSTGK